MSADKLLTGVISVALGVGVVGSAIQFSMYTVEPGHRAVIFDRFAGIKQTTKSEGTKLLIPWFQKPHFFDVRTTPFNIRTESGSRDLQTVSLHLRVLYRPQVEKLPQIFSETGLEYAEKIMPAIGNEVLKQVVANHDASELITQREDVSIEIREQLTKRAAKFNINLEDVSITHLAFGQEYTASIERKQVAQQEAEKSKFVVLKGEQEKKAAIIRAEGEAEAATLIAKAMASGNGFIELRRIEAAREIAETLARSPNVSFLPSSGNILLGIN